MQQAGYHHANMLASQLRADIVQQQTEMLAMMQDLVTGPPPQEDEIPVQQAANATIADNVQMQMLQILRQMQAAQNAGNANRERVPGRDRTRNRNRKTPGNASFQRADKSEYCWTHGACNHNAGACNRKAPGHRTNATLANRRGGSNAFCVPVNGENIE